MTEYVCSRLCISRSVRNWRPLTKAHLLLAWIPSVTLNVPMATSPNSKEGDHSTCPVQPFLVVPAHCHGNRLRPAFLKSVPIRFDIKEKAIPRWKKCTDTFPRCFLRLSLFTSLSHIFLVLHTHNISSFHPVSLQVEFVLFVECLWGSFRPPSAGPWSPGPPEGWWRWPSPTPPLASLEERPAGVPAPYAPMTAESESSWFPPTPAYWGSAACPAFKERC